MSTTVADLKAFLGLNASDFNANIKTAAQETKNLGDAAKTAGAAQKEHATGLDIAGSSASSATGKHVAHGAAVQDSGNKSHTAAGAHKEVGDAAHTAGEHAKESADGYNVLGTHITSLSDNLKALMPALLGFGAAIGTLFEFKEAISSFTDLAGSVRKLQQVTGDSAESASKLIFAFGELGVAPDQVVRGLKKFEQAVAGVVDAEDGGLLPAGKAQVQLWHALGIELTDTSGKIRPTNDLILEMSDVFHKLGPGIEATALAQKTFGRAGLDMLPVLLKGSEALKELEEEATKLGHVLSQEDVDAYMKNKMATKEWHAALEGIQIQLGSALMPIVSRVTELLVAMSVGLNQQVVPAIKATASFLGEVLGPAFEAAGGVIRDFAGFIGDKLSSLGGFIADHWQDAAVAILGVMTSIVEGVTGAVGAIAGGISWLAGVFSDGFNTIVDIVSSAASEVYDLLSYLNPFAEHSPSLVSQVKEGIDAIVAMYKGTPDALSRLKDAAHDLVGQQDDLNEKIATATDDMNNYKTAIDSAKSALNEFKSANLAEDAPFVATQKALQQQIDQLNLTKLQLEAGGGALTAKQTATGASGKQTTATVKTGLGLSVDAIDAQIKEIQNKLDQSKLEEKLNIDPLKDKIKSLTDTTKTLTFNDIVAGIKTNSDALATLQPQYDTSKQSIADYKQSLKETTEVLKAYNGAIQELTPKTGGGGAGAPSLKTSFDDAKKSIDKAKESMADAKDKLLDLKQAASDFKDSIEGLAQKFSPLVDFVQSASKVAWTDMSAAFGAVKESASGTDWSGIGSSLKEISQAALSGSLKVLASGFDAVKSAVSSLDGVFGPLVRELLSNAISQGDKLYRALIPLGQSILDLVGSLGGLAKSFKPVIDVIVPIIIPALKMWAEAMGVIVVGAIELMLKSLSIGITILGTAAVFSIEHLTRIIELLVDGIKILTKTYDLLAEWAAKIIDGLLDALTESWKKITIFFGNIPSFITDAIPDPLKVLVSVGWDIITGFYNGLWNKAQEIIPTVVGKIIDLIPGPLRKFFGISSPSTLMADTVGQPISEGIAQGILNGIPMIVSAISTVQAVASYAMLDLLSSIGMASDPSQGLVKSGGPGAVPLGGFHPLSGTFGLGPWAGSGYLASGVGSWGYDNWGVYEPLHRWILGLPNVGTAADAAGVNRAGGGGSGGLAGSATPGGDFVAGGFQSAASAGGSVVAGVRVNLDGALGSAVNTILENHFGPGALTYGAA